MIDDKNEPSEEDWETVNEDWREVPYSITSCWFCGKVEKDGNWLFSTEFDCYLHEKCLLKEIKEMVPSDPETPIFKKEFYGE